MLILLLFNVNLVFAQLNYDSKNHFFIENKGQLETNVLFYAQLKNQNIVITKSGFSYDNFDNKTSISNHHRVDIHFDHFNENCKISKSSPSISYDNYYINGIAILKVKKYQLPSHYLGSCEC